MDSGGDLLEADGDAIVLPEALTPDGPWDVRRQAGCKRECLGAHRQAERGRRGAQAAAAPPRRWVSKHCAARRRRSLFCAGPRSRPTSWSPPSRRPTTLCARCTTTGRWRCRASPTCGVLLLAACCTHLIAACAPHAPHASPCSGGFERAAARIAACASRRGSSPAHARRVWGIQTFRRCPRWAGGARTGPGGWGPTPG